MPHLAPATGVHGGHCTGWHPDAEANHAGKWDRPLVHSCLSRPHLPCVCGIGLVLSIPEVEEERSKEKKVCVDALQTIVGKHEELAKKLRQLPREPL